MRRTRRPAVSREKTASASGLRNRLPLQTKTTSKVSSGTRDSVTAVDEQVSLAPAGPRESLAERGATIESSWSDGERRYLLTAEPFARYSLDEADVPVLEHEARVRALVAGQQHPDVPGEAGELIRAEEASALHDAGMELGSHSLSAPRSAHARRRASSSMSWYGVEAGDRGADRPSPAARFAYPYGLYDERVVQAAGDGGLRARLRLAALGPGGRSRRHACPRRRGTARTGSHSSSLGLRRPSR